MSAPDAPTGRRLIIDGGQTGTRVRLIIDGHITEHEAAPVRTDHPVVEQIADVARAALADHPDTTTVLAAGVSGLTPEHSRPGDLLRMTATMGVSEVRLAHDSVSAYLGANGLAFGVTAAVGTGVVTLGVGPAGTARVDGWGHIVGDAGSAYWMGRAGIDAALRAFDGRGQATGLCEAAVVEFGPLPEIYMKLQADAGRVRRIAGFARTVGRLAQDGDDVAVTIIRAAATELTAAVRAALDRSGRQPGAPARISWMGAVLTNNSLLRAEFISGVHSLGPGVEVGPPRGSSLDGVNRLLDLPHDHPLWDEVSAAT
ncbi:N-acetylglucosamine kinase [Gordonia sp. NPDC003429]